MKVNLILIIGFQNSYLVQNYRIFVVVNADLFEVLDHTVLKI